MISRACQPYTISQDLFDKNWWFELLIIYDLGKDVFNHVICQDNILLAAQIFHFNSETSSNIEGQFPLRQQ